MSDAPGPDEMDEPRKGAGLERLQAAWRRRKWLAVAVFALPCTAAVTLTLSLPALYRSTATVLVERQQVPEAFVRPTVTSELETRLQTISQEILSRSRLEALVTRFNLYPDLRTRLSSEEVIERMRKDISLELKSTETKGRTNTTVAFALSYQGRDPSTVALVTNTVASFYIEENLKVRERQAAGTADFLKAQLTEAKKRLDEQERRVSEFKRRYLGELPQQMQANLATLEALHAQLRLNSDNQVRATERRDALQAQLAEAASMPVLAAPSGAPAILESRAQRVARLKLELTTALASYTERHPTVRRLKAEIEALEQAPEESASDQGPAGPPPATPYALRLREALNAIEAEIKVLKNEDKRLRTGIAAYQARVENTPKREQEMQDISRDTETTRDLYQSLAKRHEEAQIAENMEQRQKGEQFRVLDSAVASGVPAAPNRLKLLAIGLFLSLGLALGALMLAETVDTSFHSLDELRAAVPLPVLVSIPQIVTEADGLRRRGRVRLAAAGILLGVVLVAGTSFFLAHGNERIVVLLTRGRI